MPCIVRPARPEDAARLAELAAELGYPSSAEALLRRSEELRARSEHAVFVLEDAERVLGFVHAEHVHALVSEPHVEIAALVVASTERGRGRGRALLERAEAWARERGVSSMRVRSRSAREGAHAFYRRSGYAVVKTQLCFARELDAPPPRAERGR